MIEQTRREFLGTAIGLYVAGGAFQAMDRLQSPQVVPQIIDVCDEIGPKFANDCPNPCCEILLGEPRKVSPEWMEWFMHGHDPAYRAYKAWERHQQKRDSSMGNERDWELGADFIRTGSPIDLRRPSPQEDFTFYVLQGMAEPVKHVDKPLVRFEIPGGIQRSPTLWSFVDRLAEASWLNPSLGVPYQS